MPDVPVLMSGYRKASLPAIVVLAALFGGLLHSLPVAAAARSRLTLGRVNVFTAESIAGIRVHIPRPATFESGIDSKDIQIEGAGRMTGYVLLQEGVRMEDRVTVSTTFSNFCEAPGCRTEDPFFWHAGSNVPYEPKTDVSTLPPGDYLLYVVADGAPVTVTLRLGGLSGSRRVALTRSADGAIMVPQVRTSVEPTKSAYWFGEEVSFSGPSGIAIPLMRFETGKVVTNRREACYYRGDPAVPHEVAYGPGCPTAELGIAVQENGYADGHEVIDGYFSQVSGRGRWGFGMNYVAGGEVREADSLFFYLDVDPAEL